MRTPTVLIAEDEDHTRDRLCALTRGLGFEVVPVANGEDAIAAVDRERPDLVITDLHMPGLGGRHLVALLRQVESTRETPIMVVTADSRRVTKIDLLEAGADEFIGKPVEPEEFRARLRSLARRIDLVDALDDARGQLDDAMRRLEERNAELERLTLGLVVALERANEFNDVDTGNHIRRVCEYAALLGAAYGCSPEFTEQLRRYAGLHDVGKVGIRHEILKKPGRLTTAEFEEMKGHTLIGAELLRVAGLPSVAVNVAQHHHERWDGSGYPHGLEGESIPIEARIVAVVDVFDALVSKRCYKPAFPVEEAWAELERSAGTHLDPELVRLFKAESTSIDQVREQYTDQVSLESPWE